MRRRSEVLLKAGYDVAVWLRSENVWPEITLIVQAETARDAVIVVLHARWVRRAVKVAANARDGSIHRWYDVKTLVDGFDCRCATHLPMGWSEKQQALIPGGDENVNVS